MNRAPWNRTRQSGFTLLEVLIALVILSIGLLGLAALETTALRNNHGAYLRTQATLQAYDMADRMRANGPANSPVADYNGVGSGPTPTDPGCVLTGCTPAQMATYDAYAWNTENAALLPSGHGTVTQQASGLYQITVQWDDGNTTAPAAATGPLDSVTVVTQP